MIGEECAYEMVAKIKGVANKEKLISRNFRGNSAGMSMPEIKVEPIITINASC